MVVVTVGGPPGSGTSTLCRLLEEALDLKYIYAGQLFRDKAASMGLTLADISGQEIMDAEGVPTWFLPAPKVPKGPDTLDWIRSTDTANV